MLERWTDIWKYVADVIDILIVAYVFYKIMMLLRGTRAIQLLQGILIIILAWVLSSLLQLRTLEWLMSQAFTYGVLVIMIIFQPELRRALEQLGRGNLFIRQQNPEVEKTVRTIDAFSKAVDQLSKRRIGALIVIERKIVLGDYIDTGIPLHAEVSPELLINIFIPNTPLHDGAVIVRGNELVAAACYLPLSENPFISKELGTRHRAAIGISEVTDCISLVVSEETGHISIAENGVIDRGLTPEQVHDRLREELVLTAKEKQTGFRKKRGQASDG